MGFSLQCAPQLLSIDDGAHNMFAAMIFLTVEVQVQVQAQSLTRCSEASALFRQPPLKNKGRLQRYTDNKSVLTQKLEDSEGICSTKPYARKGHEMCHEMNIIFLSP